MRRHSVFLKVYQWLIDSDGSVCSACRYRVESVCCYWELIMLEVRFVTMFVGTFVSDPLLSASLVFAITLCLLLTQAMLKPYKETAEDAAHWSSANKMGTVGYSSQLVVLAVGLLCVTLGDSASEAVKIALTLIAVVALMVPLSLTAKIIVMNKDTYVRVATDIVRNVLHNSRSDEEQTAT